MLTCTPCPWRKATQKVKLQDDFFLSISEQRELIMWFEVLIAWGFVRLIRFSTLVKYVLHKPLVSLQGRTLNGHSLHKLILIDTLSFFWYANLFNQILVNWVLLRAYFILKVTLHIPAKSIWTVRFLGSIWVCIVVAAYYNTAPPKYFIVSTFGKENSS